MTEYLKVAPLFNPRPIFPTIRKRFAALDPASRAFNVRLFALKFVMVTIWPSKPAINPVTTQVPVGFRSTKPIVDPMRPPTV